MESLSTSCPHTPAYEYIDTQTIYVCVSMGCLVRVQVSVCIRVCVIESAQRQGHTLAHTHTQKETETETEDTHLEEGA